MKLETFFEKFDELSDTPNGVKQLRELVMQLAVEGGLVPHSAAEPAVPYASVEDATSINVSDIPENWRVVLLADAIKNRSGNSKLIKGKLHEEPAAGRFQGFSASGADVWCDDYEHEGQAIIISAVGARCGKAFKASGKWSAIANTNITRPEPTLFDFDFAYLVLNNEHFWVRGGSAQPFVKFPPSLDRHFALPPLAEQKRIVAKVDELMALCDRLEAQQQERETRHAALARASLARFADAPTPANLPFLFHPSYAIPPADLRKSILTLAVQGKLVPQDPNDEPASELLERLARELTPEQRRRQAAPLSPLPAEALQYELPDSWTWARFRDVAIIASNLVKPDDFLDFTHLAPDNIEKGNGVLLPCATVREDRVISSNHRFYPGQIVYSKIRPNLAKVVVVDFDGLCSADMYPIDALIDAFYLQRYMLSESFLVQAVKTDTRVAMPKINQMELNAIAVPLPPLAEQRRIVAKVEQLMALVDALETQLAASLATAANLLSALVAELTATA